MVVRESRLHYIPLACRSLYFAYCKECYKTRIDLFHSSMSAPHASPLMCYMMRYSVGGCSMSMRLWYSTACNEKNVWRTAKSRTSRSLASFVAPRQKETPEKRNLKRGRPEYPNHALSTPEPDPTLYYWKEDKLPALLSGRRAFPIGEPGNKVKHA